MKINIARVWKDEEYSDSLIAAGYEIPENPAGAMELNEEELAKVAGGKPKSNLYNSEDPLCVQTAPGPLVCGTATEPFPDPGCEPDPRRE